VIEIFKIVRVEESRETEVRELEEKSEKKRGTSSMMEQKKISTLSPLFQTTSF
jgi:hypothetical protein